MDGIFKAVAPWNDLRDQLGALLNQPIKDGLFAGKMSLLCAEVRRRIDEDADGALLAIMQFDQSDYGVTHSLQTAVISDIYGQLCLWTARQRLSALGAALTMNIATLDLQREMWLQQEPPSSEQAEAIRTHPLRGREMLEGLGVRDELWLRVVAEHHESNDGSGYPTGTSAPHPIATVVNLVDRYSAKISRRRYRAAVAPEIAIRELRQLSNGRNVIIDRMIQAVGLYPPGTFVELVNGEIGVVTSRGQTKRPPRVFALLTADGREVAPAPRDTGQPEFAIKGTAGSISSGTTASLPRLVAKAAAG